MSCCQVECDEKAVVEVRDGPAPDDYTQTCSAHVGELLDPVKVSTVYKIGGAHAGTDR